MKTALVAIIAAAGLAATPAMSVTWDTDDDGTINPQEFAEGMTAANTFDRFDDDNDNVLTPEEVGLGEPDEAFRRLDTNNDGVLSEAELNVGLFATYDTDESGEIDVDEMAEGAEGADQESAYERVFDHRMGKPPRK